MTKNITRLLGATALFSASLILPALAQAPAAPPFAAAPAPHGPVVPPSLIPVGNGLSVVKFDNANSFISEGEDGTLLIEPQFANRAQALSDYLKTVTKKPIRIVIDTHWHSDHAGGNELFRSQGAITIADEISRRRLAEKQVSKFTGRTQEALNPLGLPMVTFSKSMTVHFNGDDIEIVHHPEAHTDGDSTVYFRKANVIHMGDLFTTDVYTNVRNVDAFVAALDSILARIDDKTKVIPWHGDVSSKKDLSDWRQTLFVVGNRVKALMAAGKSESEIIASKPFADFNARWNGGGRADQVVTMIIAGEKGQPD